MGGDIIEYSDGDFAKAVYVKGGSGDPSIAPGTVDSVTVAPTFTMLCGTQQAEKPHHRVKAK
jgi:hypothetical protein